MPELMIENWYGMIAPSRHAARHHRRAEQGHTPPRSRDPGVKERLAEQGLTTAGNSPEQFRDFIARETTKWAKVIKDAGIQTTRVSARLPLFAASPDLQHFLSSRFNVARICAGAPPIAAPASAASGNSARRSRAFGWPRNPGSAPHRFWSTRARSAATSGITPTPMPAATIWPMVSKLFSRARKRRRAPSCAACALTWACSAIELIRPTKSRSTTSLKSTCRRFASSSSRAVTSTRRSSLNGDSLDIVRKRVFGGEPEIGGAGDDGAGDVDAFALLDVDRNARMRGQKGRQRLRQIFRKARGVGEEADGGLRAAGKRRPDRRASPRHCGARPWHDRAGFRRPASARRRGGRASAAHTPSASSSPLIRSLAEASAR